MLGTGRDADDQIAARKIMQDDPTITCRGGRAKGAIRELRSGATSTARARVSLSLIATILREVFAMRGIPNIGQE
jgi:hypothetical protein